MQNNIKAQSNDNAKLTFLEVLNLPVGKRKEFIEKNTPHMLGAFKSAALKIA